MDAELKRNMWKERTRQAVLLLQEVKNRLLDDSVGRFPEEQAENAEAVACWIDECFANNPWLQEARTFRISPARLDEIDKELEKDENFKS